MKKTGFYGQALIEYALILVLISIVVILTLSLLGVSIGDVFCKVAGGLNLSACAKPTEYCKDNFNNADDTQGVTGSWKFGNGQACVNGQSQFYNKCSMSTMTETDYTVTLENAVLTQGNGYGVFFRVTETKKGINAYVFQYDPGAKGFVFRKWVNGKEIYPSIAQVSTPNYDWYGKPHKLEVRVVGDTFTGYLDGVAILTGKDSTYTTGGVGVRTWDGTKLCTGGLTINPPSPQ